MKGYVLITGVSTGIGFHATMLFAKNGYHVFGTVRKLDDAKELESSLGDSFTPLVVDVQNQEQIDAAYAFVKEKVGERGLSGLINNAGLAVNGPVMHLKTEDIAFNMDVNYLGPIRMVQRFGELLGIGTKSPYPPGRILNVSSISGEISRPFLGPYSASKFALEAISDAMRVEFGIYNVPVVVIQPGPTKTPIWTKARADQGRFQDTDYAPIFRKMDKAVDAVSKGAIEVDKVTKVMLHAFETPKPKTRYLVAPNNFLFWLAKTLFTDRMLDAMSKKQMALARN
ncbi:MAG: SDR family NAD(P)-dependent oxidoreductase [Saprospiraceae bacterium]|nr:SDR family NAD(P)-dependent oxidoreductase [Saprospiraceae bacterium]